MLGGHTHGVLNQGLPACWKLYACGIYRVYAELFLPVEDSKNVMDFWRATHTGGISPGTAKGQSDWDRRVNVFAWESERDWQQGNLQSQFVASGAVKLKVLSL